jgi:hypothetical protein
VGESLPRTTLTNVATTNGSASLAAPPPDFYRWSPAAKPAEVQIEFGCMSRLLKEIMRGFGVLPRRGVEMGGLLLGSVERSPGSGFIVRVEDFEPVPCRHSRGAAWLLSDEEQIVFEDTLSRWHHSEGKRTYAVGFYRSHTREGMGMTAEDLDLYARCFPDPAAIVLLVKPFATRSSVGALFFRENGHVRSESSYQEFPFNSRELGGPDDDPPADSPVALQATPIPPPISAIVPPADPGVEMPRGPSHRSFSIPDLSGFAPQPPAHKPSAPSSRAGRDPSGGIPPMAPATHMITDNQLSFGLPTGTRDPGTGKRSRSGWVWIPLSFVFLIVGVGLGMFVALSVGSQLPGPLRHDPYSLGLTVSPSADSLLVRWDRSSAAIQRADRATLLINDGGAEKAVHLDRLQLQTGSVIYRKSPNQVRFRLEVEARDGVMLSESLDFHQ